MTLGFYDRSGQEITLERYAELYADLEYRTIARDTIGTILVSTVWLGLDMMPIGIGVPLIFESMLFQAWAPIGSDRYPTEAAALAGHDQLVAAVRAGNYA